MPVVEYPFVRPTPSSRLRPMLHVRIGNPLPQLHLDTVGLIDTGADECALPARFAELLGYDLHAGKEKHIATGNGVTTAYSHVCRLEVFGTLAFGHALENPVYVIEDTPVNFMLNVNTVLLGVGNFLSRFVLTLDYPNHVFSIRWP